ncbi:MAG TPA: hypothetical protein VMP03_02575 [Methylomirabilota bacterium]|nr:hypothetical protein [Methylomirabilota bacterium]
MDRLETLERELDSLSAAHPLYPRAWQAEIDARLAESPWFDLQDVVVQMREERNLIAPGPATSESLVAYERKYLDAFDPEERSEPVRRHLANVGA